MIFEGIDINLQGAEWQAIERLVRRRMAELVDEAMNPVLSGEQRSDRVARHDELATLLKAPQQARARAIDAANARLAGDTGGMY